MRAYCRTVHAHIFPARSRKRALQAASRAAPTVPL